MYSLLIKQYHEILALLHHHGDIINFSDEEYGKYQPTIQYMVQKGYLQDLKIANCNAFLKTTSFPHFEEHILELIKENKSDPIQAVTNIHIQGNVSNTNFANGNDIQQTAKNDPDGKSWAEKYAIPIIVAVIGLAGMIISAVIQ